MGSNGSDSLKPRLDAEGLSPLSVGLEASLGRRRARPSLGIIAPDAPPHKQLMLSAYILKMLQSGPKPSNLHSLGNGLYGPSGLY